MWVRQRALVFFVVLLAVSTGISGAEEAVQKKDSEYTADDGSVMVLIREGKFMMGSPEGEGGADEHPRHKVRLESYFIGKYDVTNEQYAVFLNSYGKDTDDKGQKMIYEYERGVQNTNGRWRSAEGYEKHPVVYVTWYGAKKYAEYYGMRLPTEAEWEKAARAGSKTKYSFGDSKSELGDYEWFNENSGNTTHPVGKKKPNAWGLYDMSGNVWQWCSDLYDENYYKVSANNNPQGPNSGRFRVLRGGCWSNYAGWGVAGWGRSADRSRYFPEGPALDLVGFRCAVGVVRIH